MSFKELPIMPDKSKGVLLFYPYVSKKSSVNLKKDCLEDGWDKGLWLINLRINLKKFLQISALL